MLGYTARGLHEPVMSMRMATNESDSDVAALLARSKDTPKRLRQRKSAVNIHANPSIQHPRVNASGPPNKMASAPKMPAMQSATASFKRNASLRPRDTPCKPRNIRRRYMSRQTLALRCETPAAVLKLCKLQDTISE